MPQDEHRQGEPVQGRRIHGGPRQRCPPGRGRPGILDQTLDSVGLPLSVDADDEGRVWLVVGTDSVFEGLTRLYYARISYTLALE